MKLIMTDETEACAYNVRSENSNLNRGLSQILIILEDFEAVESEISDQCFLCERICLLRDLLCTAQFNRPVLVQGLDI